MTAHRLTPIQRYVLAQVRDHGGPMVIVWGHKTTHVGTIRGTTENAIATQSIVIHPLVHNGYIQGHEGNRYTLTEKGRKAVGNASAEAPRTRSVAHGRFGTLVER